MGGIELTTIYYFLFCFTSSADIHLQTFVCACVCVWVGGATSNDFREAAVGEHQSGSLRPF